MTGVETCRKKRHDRERCTAVLRREGTFVLSCSQEKAPLYCHVEKRRHLHTAMFTREGTFVLPCWEEKAHLYCHAESRKRLYTGMRQGKAPLYCHAEKRRHLSTVVLRCECTASSLYCCVMTSLPNHGTMAGKRVLESFIPWFLGLWCRVVW